MRRGTVCWVNLGDASPPEFGKTRPAIVVSNTDQNALLPSVVVVPLSSKPGEIWPLRLPIELPGGKRSFAVVPGIRQVHKARLLDAMALASAGFLAGLDEALRLYLAD
jgi:mRNA-degrading endonuclease toxin of MazEF toxin-antitoxin module